MLELPIIRNERNRGPRQRGFEELRGEGPQEREQIWLENEDGEVLLPALHFRDRRRRERWQNEYAAQRQRRLPPAPREQMHEVIIEPLEDLREPAGRYQAGPTPGPYENLEDIPAQRSERGQEEPSAPRIPGPPSEPGSVNEKDPKD